jgi:LAO/AO transport system kinase
VAFANLDALVAAVRAGQPRAVGRMISLIENESPLLREVMRELSPSTGYAQVVGLTGPPGVGKSTTTAAMVSVLRSAGQRVGVLAVDPSSPFSGGALLGDRIRMQAHAVDGEVFIRSMATRGHLGGLSVAAPQALRVFDAAGCDTVLVETVGVGQSEVEVAAAVDTTLVLLAPGMGDGVQIAKAGVLEIGDVFVVNKSDHDGSQALIRELRTMIALGDHAADGWKPPIVATVAVHEQGIDEVMAALERHRRAAMSTGEWQQRRLRRARDEVEALALAGLRSRFTVAGAAGLDGLAEAVRDGHLDPYTAADRVVAAL